MDFAQGWDVQIKYTEVLHTHLGFLQILVDFFHQRSIVTPMNSKHGVFEIILATACLALTISSTIYSRGKQ